MGIDRTIYLEAFIKIPLQYEDYEKIVRSCGDHINTKGDNFCPVCGKEIKEIKVTSKSEMWIEDVIGNDNFWQHKDGEIAYLFSNQYDCGINTEENVFTVLTSELIQEKIRIFKIKHKNDMELLKEKINTEIKVEFGFLYEVS